MLGAFVQVVVDFLQKCYCCTQNTMVVPLFDGSHGDESMLYVIEKR